MSSANKNLFIFRLKNLLFALESHLVVEVFHLIEIKRIREMPQYILGVINFHGKIVPVMDLNIRFGYTHEKYQLSDAIVVLESEKKRVAILIHEAIDIIEIFPQDIELPPFHSENAYPRIVKGIAKIEGEAIMILDYNLLLQKELENIEEKEEETEAAFQITQSSFSNISSEAKSILLERSLEKSKPIQEEVKIGMQFVIVELQGEYFGIPLSNIKEFSFPLIFTPLPNCPEHIIGNMNLRGDILTIIDIRSILGMSWDTYDRSAKIVVVFEENIIVGIAVEDIYDIIEIPSASISTLPISLQPVLKKYAQGIVFQNGKKITILDISKILKSNHLIVKE